MYYGEKYLLGQTNRIVIYGAATTGAILYHNLMNVGCNIIAFMDKRADEIKSYYDLPVWSFEQAENNFRLDDELVVIIGIKNVFEHEKTAKMLKKIGCNKIIFRPYNVVEGQGDIIDKELNEAYDALLLGKIPQTCYMIEGFEEFNLKDNAIISENAEYVIANIPSYYVFTDNYENKDIIWGDIPCLGLIPHMGLFNLFLGQENDDYIEYMKFCKEAALRSGGIVISKAWEDSVYNNRLDVFNHMEYAWEHNRKFFVKNAVEASLNERGYFNIHSGKHRIVYMLVKGSRYIPLKIKKADYYKWNNYKEALLLKGILSDCKIDSLPIVLGNPFFYNYSCNASNFYEKILIKLITLIFRKQYYAENKFVFKDKKILFVNTPLSLYAKVFIMLGFQTYILEYNNDRIMLIDAMTKDHHYITEKDMDNNFYFAILQCNSTQIDIATENTIQISGNREETGEIIANGLVDGRILFASLK